MNSKYIKIYECPVPDGQYKIWLQEILEENNIPFESRIESYWVGIKMPEYKEKFVIYIPMEFKQQVEEYIDEFNNQQNIITKGIEELEQECEDVEKESKKVAKRQKIMIGIYIGIVITMISSVLIVAMFR